MIKILIVDDEAVIREGIIRSISWADYGIGIAEASNGREALEMARELKPDIVITDIRMPVMDGLELSKRLKAMLPMVRLVILTGYGEFEFAKRAIEFRVSEFVLKPVGAEELVNVALKLRDEIRLERERLEREKSNELLLKENLPVIQGELVHKLVNASYNFSGREEILKKAKALNIDLPGPLYQIFIIAIDDYFSHIADQSPENRELILDSVLNIAREAISAYAEGVVCRHEIGLLVGLLNTGNRAFDIIAMCRQVQALITKHLKLSVSFGIGSEKKDIRSVYESYDEAFNALRQRIYRGKSVVIHINDTRGAGIPEKRVHLQSWGEEERELLFCLKLIDRERASRLLDRLFERLVSAKEDYNNIKNISLYLLLSAFKGMDEMGVHIEDQLEMQFDPFQEIEKLETAADIKKWMKEVLGRLIGIIESEKNKKYKGIVKIGIDYMMKHYDEAISLTAISGKVHVTPNYFSRVFREETGETFIEWLNKYRIEKAKEFLTDIGIKTYEVAEKVGFNDYKHFSYNFRKYVGCSLTEYRDRRAKGSG